MTLTGMSALWIAVCCGQSTQIANSPDPVKAEAEEWIGRALIVRGFPAGDDLRYDAAGQALDKEKATDWTLAGFDLQRVLRRTNGDLQLDGVRVAIQYNPEQHTFERHPLKQEPMRIVLGANNVQQAAAGFQSIFSVGLEPSLQRSMPGFWSHYFIPSLAWPSDELEGEAVLALGAPPTPSAAYPELEKKAEPGFTPEAAHDHIRGTVQVKATVDAKGVPKRLVIRQPLGYGLDAKAIEAVARYKFKPGTREGVAAAMEVVVNESFE